MDTYLDILRIKAIVKPFSRISNPFGRAIFQGYPKGVSLKNCPHKIRRDLKASVKKTCLRHVFSESAEETFPTASEPIRREEHNLQAKGTSGGPKQKSCHESDGIFALYYSFLSFKFSFFSPVRQDFCNE